MFRFAVVKSQSNRGIPCACLTSLAAWRRCSACKSVGQTCPFVFACLGEPMLYQQHQRRERLEKAQRADPKVDTSCSETQGKTHNVRFRFLPGTLAL
jgi:hypothetical protein